MHLAARAGLFAAFALTLTACAATPETGRLAAADQEKFQKDRAAILAMTGEYDVTFEFRETVALEPRYELKEPYLTGAKEVVNVLEDSGDFISLQHILVVGPKTDPIVVKHWRQDWTYEPAEVLAFTGHKTFEMRPVSRAEREGAWSQAVYQVDDSPRYASVAAWSHDAGVSTWESGVTWRPLPRRDDIKRDDYDVMVCVNRHTITDYGWTHEEDNSKVALTAEGPREIVRETGINRYIDAVDVQVEAAERYWDATQGFWAAVRAEFTALEHSGAPFALADDPEGALLYMPMLELADALAAGETSEADAIAQARSLIAERTFATGEQAVAYAANAAAVSANY